MSAVTLVQFLPADTENAQIESLYVAYFGRAGDPGGMNYWLDALAHGAPLQSIAASFSVQPEAQAQYPFLADPVHASSGEVQDFISQIYHNLFGRTPEAGGLAYWQNSLEANLGNPQAIGTFILAVAKGAQGSDQTTLATRYLRPSFSLQPSAVITLPSMPRPGLSHIAIFPALRPI